MISLIRLHSYYLLTKKTRTLTVIFIGVVIGVLGLLTRPFDAKTVRIIYHASYLLDYTIEGFTLIKMVLFLCGFYTVLHLSILTPYDTVLKQRTHTVLYILSKYLVIWLYTTGVVLIISLYYVAFSMVIYGSLHPMISLNSMMRIGILITTYTLLLFTVSLYSKHHLALILVMFSFLLSDMFVNMSSTLGEVSSLGLLTNVLAPNIHVLTNDVIDFIIPKRFMLYLSFLYLTGIVAATLTSDN